MTRGERLALIAAALGTLALRLVRIGALPIFNDEAIFLRWAQLIAREPRLTFAIPLDDPKPPLHFVLLAPLVEFASDPVVAGRALSALAGALTVVFAMLIVRELGGAMRAQLAAAMLFAFSPYLAFHQRLAAADALFLAEGTAVVWLALRRRVVATGIVMAAAMLTRQVVSYVLWLIPILTLRKKAIPALLLAFALWSPYLLVERGRYAGDATAELQRRVLYKQEFRQPLTPELLVKNARAVHEWLWTYLTPPVYVAAALALLLSWRYKLLLVWFGISIVPLIAFGAVTWPRYALAAVPPLLLMTALAAGRLRAAPLLILLLSAWPIRDTTRQISDWRTQTLVPLDRWQHVTGWPAGYATQRAIEYLRRQPRATIITGAEWGLPADAVWLALDGRHTLRWADGASSELLTNKWLPAAPPAPIPADGPLFRVHRGEPAFTFEYRERIDLANPDGGDRVTIFRIR